MSAEHDTENFSLLYKGRSNLIDMLMEQSYNVDEYFGFKTNELHSLIKNQQLDMLLENASRKSKLYVKFYEICERKPKTLSKQVIDDMVEDLYTLEEILTTNDSLMIIANAEANDTIKSHIRHLWEKDNIHIVVIQIRALQFNVLKHSYVPPHRVLNDDDVKRVFDKYNIRHLKQLPELSRFDPIAQIVCLKPKQICEIMRPSKNAVETPYYRVCMNK